MVNDNFRKKYEPTLSGGGEGSACLPACLPACLHAFPLLQHSMKAVLVEPTLRGVEIAHERGPDPINQIGMDSNHDVFYSTQETGSYPQGTKCLWFHSLPTLFVYTCTESPE